ncbi:MAG: hypothetical protein ACRDRC_06700, partial [Pseudonocardiaceae bacterium]
MSAQPRRLVRRAPSVRLRTIGWLSSARRSTSVQAPGLTMAVPLTLLPGRLARGCRSRVRGRPG